MKHSPNSPPIIIFIISIFPTINHFLIFIVYVYFSGDFLHLYGITLRLPLCFRYFFVFQEKIRYYYLSCLFICTTVLIFLWQSELCNSKILGDSFYSKRTCLNSSLKQGFSSFLQDVLSSILWFNTINVFHQIDVKLSVQYMSFSAHADAKGIMQLIRQVRFSSEWWVEVGSFTCTELLNSQVNKHWF